MVEEGVCETGTDGKASGSRIQYFDPISVELAPNHHRHIPPVMFLHSRLLILLLSAIFAAGFSPPSLLSEKRASSVSRLYQYAEPAGRRDVLKVCVASAPAFVAASSLYPAAARAESAEVRGGFEA